MTRNQSVVLYGLLAAVGAGAAALAVRSEPARADDLVVTVFKSPTCGCCGNWVDHMRAAGFLVEVRDVADIAPVKAEHGVPDQLASCHTAVVDGYVLEGHVPADLVRRLLEERPAARLLAVPGMPLGSPGMEQGGRAVPYDVILYDRERGATVYASR